MIGQNVLEVIAGMPDCRAVQIVDKLDIDAEEVLSQVKALIHVGDVVSSEGRAPNGLPCTVYNVSDAFKETAVYAPLAAKATAKAFAAPGLNRIERAIEWVRQHGSATSAELHAVMGLDDTEAPSKVLASAITTRRLVKDGKSWTLGPGPGGTVTAPSPVCAPKVEVVETPRFLPPAPPAKVTPATTDEPTDSTASRVFADMVATPKASEAAPAESKATRVRGSKVKPEELVKALGPQPAPPIVTPMEAKPDAPAAPAAPDLVIVSLRPAADQPAPVYRCALWSDGMLEVQRDGLTVAEMPQAAAEAMASFLARLAGAKEAA